MTSTEIDTYQPNGQVAIPAAHDTDSWIAVCSDVIKVANVIYDTPFVPDGLRGSAPAVAAAILAGREMGLGPMTSLQHIHVIKGKPGQSALLMRALIQAAGHKWEDGDNSDTRAVVRGCRKGESKWAEVTFTADQAKRAGIDLGKYPADKLYARATVRLARRKFADVIMGMPYSAEELEDGEIGDAGTVAEVTAASETPAAPKPRTAQRKRQDRKPHVDQGEQGVNRPAAESAQDGPPLPGEEEPSLPPDEHDQPGTATRGKGGQLTAIWTVLRTVFEFGEEEKDQARAVCEHVIGRDLGGTTGNMSWNEATTVLDTLGNWQHVAESNGESPRAFLIALMSGEEAGDGEPEGGTDG